MEYNRVSETFVEKLKSVVGERQVVTERERLLDYGHDEFSLPDIARVPEALVKPGSTEEVAEVLRLAEAERIPVTPRGGGTGLCGGCVPCRGGIVLSLERMNRFLEFDRKNQMIVVEAGVMLMDLYERIKDEGLFFPPHPGDESAMIGGLIATNAGGSRAVKYGVVRNYVRGLEVVLPSGKALNLGGKVMKSSTGYNLLHLMIGSEGTLGIITRATIQLLPSPQAFRSLVIPYDNLEDAIDTVPRFLERKILPLAVEFVPSEVIRITEKFLKKKWPTSVGNTYLLVILDASTAEELDRLSEEVAEVCLENRALDVFVADSPGKQRQVLEIRSKIYEAIKTHTLEILDIAVPRAEIAAHVKRVQEVAEEHGMWLPTFGHAADGNVHTHIMKARYEEGRFIPLPEEEWKAKWERVRKALYRDCRLRGGVISGEHGIGMVKKAYLPYVLQEETIALMKEIKRVFDPHHILNPGKIIDRP